MSKKFNEELSVYEPVVELVEGFKPDAVDGDNDGFVQDGTQFERPEEVIVEEVTPTYVPYNLLDEMQFLVRYTLSDGRIFREFCTTEEQATTYKEIYAEAAVEKGLTLISAVKAV